MDSYWNRITAQRVGRRRALAMTGATGLAAAFLAACGGGGDGGDAGKTTGSDLVEPAVDTFTKSKRGGILKDYAQAEPRSLDPVNPLADYNRIAPAVYSTLLGEKPGHLKPSAYELVGRVAQSFEIAPDGLQITFKLRPNVKFHNRPPVNGRTLDTDDVLFQPQEVRVRRTPAHSNLQ